MLLGLVQRKTNSGISPTISCAYWFCSSQLENLVSSRYPTRQSSRSLIKIINTADVVLISLAFYNKVPQTGWLKTTEVYFLTVVDARSLKSNCWQGHAPSKPARGGLFFVSWLLPVPGNPLLVAAQIQSLPLSSHGCCIPCSQSLFS